MPPFQLLDELVTPTVKPIPVFEAETIVHYTMICIKNIKDTKKYSMFYYSHPKYSYIKYLYFVHLSQFRVVSNF